MFVKITVDVVMKSGYYDDIKKMTCYAKLLKIDLV